MFRRAIMISVLLAVAACAGTSTQVVGSWKDDQYSTKISKVVVISLADETPIRQKEEHIVVAKLRKRGIDAVASSDIMRLDEKLTRATVSAAIAGKGFDSVLVTRPLGTDMNTGYVAPDSTIFFSNLTVTPGYTTHQAVVFTQIELYEAQHGHLVWSMTTRITNHSTVKDIVESYCAAMTKKLAQAGLI
jgi:hypothetical protein